MDQFLEFLKEEVLPGVWSKGVQFSRAAKSISLISHATNSHGGSEWKFKIQTTERILAFQVTLWPDENDSYCNCGSKIEPCHHIVAVALAVQNGLVSESTQDSLPKLEYSWRIDLSARKIHFQRALRIPNPDQRRPLTGSLVSLIGGIQSGRISGPLPPATPLDLKIDSILSQSILRWNELLSALRELPDLSAEGLEGVSTLSLRRGQNRPGLVIDRLAGDSAFTLRLKLQDTRPEWTFQENLAIWKGESGAYELGLQTREAIPTYPKRIACDDDAALEVFLRETLPKLRAVCDVEIRAPGFPELVELDPAIVFHAHPLKDGNVSLTARIEYPAPSSEGTAPNDQDRRLIARRDFDRERALHRQLKQDYSMSPEQPITLDSEAAFALRARTGLTALDPYLQTTLQTLGGLSLEPALARPEEVLHLLRLKANAPASTLPNSSSIFSSILGSAPEALPEVRPSSVSPELWARLRDYQKQGVTWLRQRADEAGNSNGAILADDMGLGKTLQTLCAVPTPALVIVPTSLIHNWMTEARTFRPEWKVCLYHGPERALDETADLTITTYGTLRQEVQTRAPKLLARAWASAVLDEAHWIRNPDTQAAIASFQIQARLKLALTGTPIQNRTRDLWSLFQFIAPGWFAGESEMTPALIAPFVLRRTKDEVLRELPPKTYLEHSVELPDDERATYESALAAAKREVAERYADQEALHPLTLFETLLRARQTCDHAGLFDPTRWSRSSAKLDALLELIEELHEAGHSVLVFSQWTRFLDRIQESLSQETSNRKKWLRLDGATRNRAEVLEKFQNSKEACVFLLSLHAGGVGLNLTRADHVIFCDPWWNPFVELQAEDRVYRMGQEKPVTIHRLICEGTIEERIRLLQAEKQKLGEVFLTSPELSKSDLEMLL